MGKTTNTKAERFTLYFTNHGFAQQGDHESLEAARDAARAAGFDSSVIQGYGYDRAARCITGTVVAHYSVFGGFQVVRS